MELAFADLHLCAPLLEPLDGAFARRTYLDAWLAAAIAGRFAGAGELHEVARAARSARPPAGVPGPSDLLLDGARRAGHRGPRRGSTPLLGRAARVFADEEITSEERLRWSVPAVMAASMVWDDERWPAIEARHVRSCREAGLLAQLALSVNG